MLFKFLSVCTVYDQFKHHSTNAGHVLPLIIFMLAGCYFKVQVKHKVTSTCMADESTNNLLFHTERERRRDNDNRKE